MDVAYHDKDSSIALGSVRRCMMPEKQTLRRARKAKRERKAPSTQAGEFVREEIEHVRRGKHGALDKAGDRDWFIQGTAGEGEAPAARER